MKSPGAKDLFLPLKYKANVENTPCTLLYAKKKKKKPSRWQKLKIVTTYVTEASTVLFMAGDPGCSLIFTLKGSFYPFKSFSGCAEVECPSGKAADFDLMPSDISLALLISWVRCQLESRQREQRCPKEPPGSPVMLPLELLFTNILITNANYYTE